MSQVCVATAADYLAAGHEQAMVFVLGNGVFIDRLEKTRPAGVRVEFRF
jgi:hypothetical protein